MLLGRPVAPTSRSSWPKSLGVVHRSALPGLASTPSFVRSRTEARRHLGPGSLLATQSSPPRSPARMRGPSMPPGILSPCRMLRLTRFPLRCLKSCSKHCLTDRLLRPPSLRLRGRPRPKARGLPSIPKPTVELRIFAFHTLLAHMAGCHWPRSLPALGQRYVRSV